MTEQLPFISETSSLPLLSSMCRVRRGEHFRVQGKTVSRPMLCLILQGDGVLVLNDKVYTAEAHQLYVLKPGTTIEAAARSAVTEFIILSMDTVCLQQVRGQWIMSSSSSSGFPLDWETGRLIVRHDQQTRARFEQLYEAYRGVHPDHFISIHSQLHELLQYLSENRLEENYEKVDPALERSIKYMRRFMSEGISMDQLAKIAGLTPSSYSRSFKKAKGMSPTDYLNRLRIDEAKKQLKQESCVLKDVAVSVGYGNEYYFSRKFKQTLGIAPSLYMKKDQIRVATASRMGFHENLSSLGLHPVAAMDAFHDRELDEVEQQQWLASQLEKLRQAKPDLIISDFYHQSFYNKLKSIAPTVILDQADDWKENHVRLAELVGREQQALQNFKQLELRNLDIGLRLKQHFGQERIMLIHVTNQSIRLQENIEHPLNRLIYGELGLKPAQIMSTDFMTDEYAADSIPMLDTDHLFMNRVSNSPASEKLLRRMKQTTAWNRSPAVLKGNVHDISDWSVRSWTPTGRHQIMDELEQIVQQLVTLSRVGLIGQL